MPGFPLGRQAVINSCRRIGGRRHIIIIEMQVIQSQGNIEQPFTRLETLIDPGIHIGFPDLPPLNIIQYLFAKGMGQVTGINGIVSYPSPDGGTKCSVVENGLMRKAIVITQQISRLVLPEFITGLWIEIVKSEIGKKIEKIIGIISLVLQGEIMRKVGEDPDIRISAARLFT